MLQEMRDQTQGLGFKIIVFVLIFVLAVFGFGGFNLFANSGQEVASVNGVEITVNDLQRESQMEMRRIASQFGENFDTSLLDPNQVQQSALNRLITQELLLQNADDLGLTVSRTKVDRTIVADPSFALDGQFDEGTYRRLLRGINQTPQGYLDQMQRSLTLSQLSDGVTSSAILPEWELRAAARVLSQTRDIGFLTFAPEAFREGVSVSDDDVLTRYEENQADYMTPQTVDAEVVELTWRALTDDDSIEVTEEDLLSAYEQEKQDAAGDEQRDSSHILVQVNQTRDAAAALSRINEISERLAAGEAFGALAEEYSDDPGSKAKQGSLGYVGEGVFDPAFEQALWALESTGDISEPVLSAFGYHLIRLDGVRATEVPSFEERRVALDAELREAQARRLFADRVKEMDQLAFETAGTLDTIADSLSLTIRTVAGVSADAGTDVFTRPELREALFTSEVLNEGFNSAALQIGDDQAYVVRAATVHEPSLQPLAEVSEAIREQLTADAAADAARTAFAAALSRVESGEAVLDVARDYDLRWQSFAKQTRSSRAAPAEVVRAAFELEPPSGDDKSVGDVALGGTQGDAIVTVTAVYDGDYTAMTEAERDGLRRFLEQRSAQLDFSGIYATFEDEGDVQRPAIPAG